LQAAFDNKIYVTTNLPAFEEVFSPLGPPGLKQRQYPIQIGRFRAQPVNDVIAKDGVHGLAQP